MSLNFIDTKEGVEAFIMFIINIFQMFHDFFTFLPGLAKGNIFNAVEKEIMNAQ